jgi:antitoxin YefM
MATTTYSHLRENLAEVWNEVESSQTPIIITRRDHEDLALIPAGELQSLRETAYLLRSPKNAARLLAALTRSLNGSTAATTVDVLRAELGASAVE